MFEWPCWKRKAHHAHDITGVELREMSADQLNLIADSVEVDPLGVVKCPGVKAHPATMIGGNHPEKEWI